MSTYESTIGLEIHAELKTRTKMFCDSLNDPDEKRPNVNVCPVCLGHPGTLPTINKLAVEGVIKTGLALNGTINPATKFDRKNYFYPDLPKGYQISQYDEPLVLGGELLGIHLTRIHLEEDAGRLVHSTNLADKRGLDADKRGSNQRESASYVDFNRAGVPLMELVTEPEMKSAETAVAFAKELQLILRYLGVSDADLERGQMRFDANVSVSDSAELGVKVEVKNLNSFRALEEAIIYETKRQSELLEKGEKVKQETRGWDDVKKKTVSQRSKEEAHDYRYFPEPDLPPFETSVFDLEHLKSHLPELPAAKRERFKKQFGFSDAHAELLVQDKPLADFFEQAESELKAKQVEGPERQIKAPRILLFNYLTSDLMGLLHDSGFTLHDVKINPEELAHLVDLISDGKIMSRQAKNILRKMFVSGEDPETILTNEGLGTVSDETELLGVVHGVMDENPLAVLDYRKGKTASLQFLVGKAMGKLKGRGNPETLRAFFEKELTG